MSFPKLLGRLKEKQAELLAAEVSKREYSEPANFPVENTDTANAVSVDPDDGLQRVGSFIAPKLNDEAYRAHFKAKTASTSIVASLQAERIRRLGADVTAEELLAAHKQIKPLLRKSLSPDDLQELALIMIQADRKNAERTGKYQGPREVYVRDLYQPESPAKEKNI